MPRRCSVPRRGLVQSAVADEEVSISILAALHAGEVGRELLDLLRTVMRTQLQRLPGPTGRHPTADDVDDAVQTFVVERWDRTIKAVLAQATDDTSMTRLLHTIVGRWRIDKVRETDRGSVRRRLHDHLADVADFEQVPAGQPGAGQWRLAGSVAAPWEGRLEDLVAAARAVRAAAVRWTDRNRRPPMASASDLTAVLRAVLVAAGGSVDEQPLVEVIVRRFPATLDPELAVLDTTTRFADHRVAPDEVWQAEQDAASRASIAAAIFRQLTQVERAVLPLLDNVAAVQQLLGRGRSTAYTTIGKVKDRVVELAGGYEDAQQVALEVADLCAAATPPEDREESTSSAVDNSADASSGSGVMTRTAGGTS